MPDPIPPGDTSFRAIVLAIWLAEPVNVPRGGCVESVVTFRTHFRFVARPFARDAFREAIMRQSLSTSRSARRAAKYPHIP